MVDGNKEQENQSPRPLNKRWNFSGIKSLFKGKPKVPPESPAGNPAETLLSRKKSETPVGSQSELQVEALPFWEEFDKEEVEKRKTRAKIEGKHYHTGSWWKIEDKFKEFPERGFSTQELIADLNKERFLSDERGFCIPVKYMVEHSTIEEMANVFDSVFSNAPERELDRREGIYARPDICVRALDLILKRLVVKEGRTDLTEIEKNSIGKFFQGLQKVEAKMATDLFNKHISHNFDEIYGMDVTDLFRNHYSLLFGLGGRLVKGGLEAVQMNEIGMDKLMPACEYLSPHQALIALTALARPTLPFSVVGEKLFREELWNKGLEALSESVNNCPQELREQNRQVIIYFLRTMKAIVNQLGTYANFRNFIKHHPEFKKALLDYNDPDAEVIGNLSKRKNPLIDPLIVKLEGLEPRINQEN